MSTRERADVSDARCLRVFSDIKNAGPRHGESATVAPGDPNDGLRTHDDTTSPNVRPISLGCRRVRRGRSAVGGRGERRLTRH